MLRKLIPLNNPNNRNYVHIMNILPSAASGESTSSVQNRKGTQSIQRVVSLLRELTAHNKKGASASQLAAKTGIDRSTAHRMLQCLAHEDLLAFDTETHRYRFGPLAYDIGFAASERLDLPQLCKPTLARIADHTGDTVFLMVRSGDDAVCADRAAGSYPIKTFVVDVGTRRPLGVGTGNLAILSALPEDVAELVLEHNAARISAFSGIELDRVRAQVLDARRLGHVAMDVVGVHGVRAVGVAVFVGGNPVAALSIAAIAARMTPEREKKLVKILSREAKELGLALDRRMVGNAD